MEEYNPRKPGVVEEMNSEAKKLASFKPKDLKEYFCKNKADIFTFANATSVTGLALVLAGCKNIDEQKGVASIAAGRVLDLADGKIARAEQKRRNKSNPENGSNVGAFVDAFCDKIGMAAIMAAAWKEGGIPKKVLATTTALQFANAITTGISMLKHPGKDLRPVQEGKIGLFAVSLAGGLFMQAHLIEENAKEKDLNEYELVTDEDPNETGPKHSRAAKVMKAAAYATFLAALPSMVSATKKYINRAKE